MNIEKVASELLEELNKEIGQSKQNAIMLEGAMQGVRLLYQKLGEAAQNDNEKPEGTEKTVKSKKSSK